MHKVYRLRRVNNELALPVRGITLVAILTYPSANWVNTLEFYFAARSQTLKTGLSLPLSTLNTTPYDAIAMTRGFGGLLSLTKQRAFTSNLLPIYLGALGVLIVY